MENPSVAALKAIKDRDLPLLKKIMQENPQIINEVRVVLNIVVHTSYLLLPFSGSG
jgi:hypothetical protein